MAVYKPTLCTPFLKGVDARIGYHENLDETLVSYLTCQIDTSNKNITGYKIRILDSDNNQVFPLENQDKISPITELQREEFGYQSNGINSGKNGTQLKVPFFLNYSDVSNYTSYNSIYYSDKYLADHIILANTTDYILDRPLTNMEKAENWIYNDLTDTLTYNWSIESSDSRTQEVGSITLDGDKLLLGETVFIVTGTGNLNFKAGLWKVDSSNGSLFLKRLTNIIGNDSVNERVTVIQGDTFHNTSWKCIKTASKVSFGVFEYLVNGGEWYDSQGNALLYFNAHDGSFKWEITLYQGNYDTPVSGTGGTYIEYNNVDSEWLDMVLSTGKIMGTTSERVQIAGVPYSYGSSGEMILDYANSTLPEGTEAEPLVLQGKYMEMTSGNYPNGILSGDSRIYVKTYDSTYGHVYPMTNSLASTVASKATYCQFFEYSNNADEILDTDIINYTFTVDVPITFYQCDNNVWTKRTEAEMLSYSVTDRRLVIEDKDVIQPGDLFLLTNQSLPKQNGVYSYYVAYDKNGEKYNCIERAASYDEWSDFIGKIIYTMNGDFKSRYNIESLATAGSYTLWNPLSTTSGSSSLYFVPERPILLFRDHLKNDRTFDLFEVNISLPEVGVQVLGRTIDGVTVNVGDTILYRDGFYGTVTSTTTAGYTLGSKISSVIIDDYFYITKGKTMGKLVFKWALGQTRSSSSANWDLYTATILHNTKTRTFISPWNNLQKNMKICLLNNKTISFEATPSEKSKWLTINNFNDTIFYVDHEQLIESLSSEDSTDNTVPWRYNICYFFKTSNENPFYSYETPYIRLYKDGNLYSDIGKSYTYLDYEVTDKDIEEKLYQVLINKKSSDRENYDVTYYAALTNITGRYVTLGADYIHFGESSWESYQWQLYNSDGELLQDTGKKYDKDIKVVLYGLNNDGEGTVYYTVILTVQNDYNDILKYVLVLSVAPGGVSSFIRQGTFTATIDCDTQSVLLKVSGIKENTHYSIYRREYNIYQNPKKKILGYYCADDYKFYKDAEFKEEISPKNTNYLYQDIITEYLYGYNGEGVGKQFDLAESFREYKGEREPVLLNDDKTIFRDFNIKNGRSYQYIIYPEEMQVVTGVGGMLKQTFANYDGRIWQIDTKEQTQGKITMGDITSSAKNGEPVTTHRQYWSITELIPEENNLDAPILKHKYRIDNNNIRVFKYATDTGSNTQNFSRSEIETLGQYSKYGYGVANCESGSITSYLGNELIPASYTKYIERLKKSRVLPLSTNERAEMLKQWKEFCFSKNPKLLKDIKGNSWIVQILSNSITPQNYIQGVPDIINFSWKEIDSTEHIIVYGEVEEEDLKISQQYGAAEWTPLYKK